MMRCAALLLACLTMLAAPASWADTSVYRSDRYRFDVSYDTTWRATDASSSSSPYQLTLELPEEIDGGHERCFIAAIDHPADGQRLDLTFPPGVQKLLRRVLPAASIMRVDPSAITAGPAVAFNTSYMQRAVNGEWPRLSLGYVLELRETVLVIACTSTPARRKAISAALEHFASSLIVR